MQTEKFHMILFSISCIFCSVKPSRILKIFHRDRLFYTIHIFNIIKRKDFILNVIWYAIQESKFYIQNGLRTLIKYLLE